ncbi:MAG TPA: hypothetical protein VNJ05_01345 [Sphingomicrobium sp.]|nr:hypothetical protein [Sphingomicrobium sp.]
MLRLSKIALTGVAAAAIATAAAGAANHAPKTMNVPMADGSTVTIQYYGDVAPKVTVVPATRAPGWPSGWLFPEFADFDRMIADLNRRTAEMMRRMEELRRHPITGAPGMNLASAGNAPAGTTSVSVVTVSNGGKGCTRTTEVVSQGAGKPPKVTTNVSGDCGPEAKPAEPTA